MPEEIVATKAITDVAKVSIYIGKKIWSMVDAASEKPQPSKFLRQSAIESIQGKTNPNL